MRDTNPTEFREHAALTKAAEKARVALVNQQLLSEFLAKGGKISRPASLVTPTKRSKEQAKQWGHHGGFAPPKISASRFIAYLKSRTGKKD